MLLTVLSVTECPNVAVLLDRLHNALAGRPADVEVIVVDDDERARAWGMTGSPTLLVNGLDPFAVAGVEPSVSCRLYRGTDSRVGGAPTTTDLQTVLAAAPDGPALPAGGIEALTRAGQGRRAPVEGGLRAVQQLVLRTVAATGGPPGPDDLDAVARPFGRSVADVLGELAAEDFLCLDPTGRLRAIYPFALEGSRHRVRIDGGPQVWAMCAVDAIGIAAMLDRAVVIDTTDPVTTEPVRVRATRETARAEPPATAVFIGGYPGTGPAERVCCTTTNFFATRHSATRWAVAHPEAYGKVVGLDAAADLGRAIFGDLLAP